LKAYKMKQGEYAKKKLKENSVIILRNANDMTFFLCESFAPFVSIVVKNS
jgi:hypothetical protein